MNYKKQEEINYTEKNTLCDHQNLWFGLDPNRDAFIYFCKKCGQRFEREEGKRVIRRNKMAKLNHRLNSQ